MSGADVLAVFGPAAKRLRLGVEGHITADLLDEARAAVAELIEAAKPMATAAHDRGLMADILKGMRAHEAEAMHACILRLDAALANIGPRA